MVDFTTLHPFDFDRNLFNFLFNVTLLSITGNTYRSTATAVHVPVSYNGTTVACRGQNIANKQQIIIVIGR